MEGFSMEIFWLFMVFVFGGAVGSFLNVVIYRIPKGESIVFPSSHCQSCNTPLKWYHNIPILSWVVLGGKCAFCKAPIATQYPMIELISALLAVILYLKLGLVWHMPFVFASFVALLALSMIDFKYFAVPDVVNLFALVMAFVQPHFYDAIFDAGIAAVGLYLLGLATSYLAKKEAMGGADVIVAGTMAALLGFPLFFVALFLAALLAIIPSLTAKDTMVPFVPFLALATLIVYLFDTKALQLLGHILHG
jgi:leader peptidase (prepilin peptidase) / N-methyltransferase